MALTNVDWITLAFGVFNALRLASYFPQIMAVARDSNGAMAISLSCWFIWLGANASTALYAWSRMNDVNLTLIGAFNALCCLTVLGLTISKRAALASRGPRSSPVG